MCAEHVFERTSRDVPKFLIGFGVVYSGVDETPLVFRRGRETHHHNRLFYVSSRVGWLTAKLF